MKRALIFLFALLLGIAAGLTWLRLRETDGPAIYNRVLMGTLWSIQLPSGNSAQSGEAASRAFREAARIESLMSEWKPDSPLSAVNAAAGRGLVRVPAELREILQRGIEYGRDSAGAFDITWLGMGNLWQLDADFAPPSPEAILQARSRVDYRKLRIEGNAAGLPEEGMAIGLGAIAKGYAVDRAASLLRESGVVDFLINAGGDVLASGERNGAPWNIGIRHPRGASDRLIAILGVSGAAVATSGDYERFRIVDGIRYHHIIDPRTGLPARGCQSVTVVAPTSEEADALATAIFVLGPENGLALAESRQGVECLLVDAQGKIRQTAGMEIIAERR